MNESLRKLGQQAQDKLRDGADVRTELLFIEIVRQHEQVGDHALSVARALSGYERVTGV